MKRKIQINIAWTLWNLLTNLSDKIRKHYEEDFIDIILAEDEQLMFFKDRSYDFIPF